MQKWFALPNFNSFYEVSHLKRAMITCIPLSDFDDLKIRSVFLSCKCMLDVKGDFRFVTFFRTQPAAHLRSLRFKLIKILLSKKISKSSIELRIDNLILEKFPQGLKKYLKK